GARGHRHPERAQPPPPQRARQQREAQQLVGRQVVQDLVEQRANAIPQRFQRLSANRWRIYSIIDGDRVRVTPRSSGRGSRIACLEYPIWRRLRVYHCSSRHWTRGTMALGTAGKAGRAATLAGFLLITGSTLAAGLLNAALIALAARRGEIGEIA